MIVSSLKPTTFSPRSCLMSYLRFSTALVFQLISCNLKTYAIVTLTVQLISASVREEDIHDLMKELGLL